MAETFRGIAALFVPEDACANECMIAQRQRMASAIALAFEATRRDYVCADLFQREEDFARIADRMATIYKERVRESG